MNTSFAKYAPILNAIAAALGYGLWAVYANYEHGAHVWMMAGVVQGIYAFGSTLCITHVARWVFVKSKGGFKGIAIGFALSFIVMITIPICVHNIAGTPDILQTITPGLIIGILYLYTYLSLLNKNDKM